MASTRCEDLRLQRFRRDFNVFAGSNMIGSAKINFERGLETQMRLLDVRQLTLLLGSMETFAASYTTLVRKMRSGITALRRSIRQANAGVKDMHKEELIYCCAVTELQMLEDLYNGLAFLEQRAKEQGHRSRRC